MISNLIYDINIMDKCGGGSIMICTDKKMKQQNWDIYKRNIPDKPNPIVMDCREEYRICNKDKGGYMENHNLNRYIDRCGVIKFNGFNPGKGVKLEYLRNIDVDSELRCIRRKETKCFRDFNKSMILPNKTNIDCTAKIWNNFTARN